MRSLWRRLKFLLTALALVGVVLVGVLLNLENDVRASLSVFGWQTPEATVFQWISAALLLGFLAGWGASLVGSLRIRLHRRRVARQLARTEEEVRQLRNLPLQD